MADMATRFSRSRTPRGQPSCPRSRRNTAMHRDTMHCVEFNDPDTGLLFVPNMCTIAQGERGGAWLTDEPPLHFSTLAFSIR